MQCYISVVNAVMDAVALYECVWMRHGIDHVRQGIVAGIARRVVVYNVVWYTAECVTPRIDTQVGGANGS